MPQLEHISRSFFALALAALLAGPAAAAYQVTTVSEGGTGTISGKVEFQGLVPNRKVAPTKDRETCGKNRDEDRKSTRLNSSHLEISHAAFCMKPQPIPILKRIVI